MPADKPKWGGRRVGPDGKPLGGRPRKPKSESIPAEPKAPAPKNLDLTRLATMLPEILAASEQHARTSRRTPEKNPFQIPWFPKAATPKRFAMAMDNMPVFAEAAQSWLAGGILNNAASEALLFPGYTYLSQLAQQPDFRNMAETIADDATRKWIKFEVTGDEQEKEKRQAQDFADPDGAQERRETRLKEKGKTDKVKALNDYMQKLALQKIFFDLCRDDGFFGRTHLYLNFGDDVGMNSPELKTPIGDGRDALSQSKVNKDRPLRTVKTIEPLWAYPTTYNAQNPLAADWYDPTVWYVMGTEIHASRLLRFIGRPVPDILKPAYAFGGVSLSQLISPSVDIWIRTRNSTAELIHSFSVMVLSTDLSTMLQPGTATGLLARATLFNALRDNQNLMIVNKTTEDFKNVSASLAGLDDLQAQAQEHVASTGRVPLVKYTGLQPKGLNASAEGEIAVYDDTIMAYQNRFIRPNLTTIVNFMQLSLWGEIDPEITFEFEPLRVMTEKERSEKQKADAERDGMRLDQGAISPAEVRKMIVNDPDLPYTDLDPDDLPEPPDDGLGGEFDEEGAIGKGGKPPAEGGSREERGGAEDAEVPFFASDAEWKESDHPRKPDGEFGTGGSASSKKRLTSTERAYLASYSGDDFLRVNTALRTGEDAGPAVAKLDTAIAKSTIPAGTRLYRSMTKDAFRKMLGPDSQLSVGQTLEDKGFLSTSPDPSAWWTPGGVMMQMDTPEGMPALDLSGIASNAHEKEVLLPRGLRLKVLGIKAPKNVGDALRVRVGIERA